MLFEGNVMCTCVFIREVKLNILITNLVINKPSVSDRKMSGTVGRLAKAEGRRPDFAGEIRPTAKAAC